MLDFDKILEPIKVMLVRPGKPGEIVEIDPRMTEVVKLLGATSTADLMPSMDLAVPDIRVIALGQKPEMTPNRVILARSDLGINGLALVRGTFMLVGYREEAFSSAGRLALSDKQIETLKAIFGEVDDLERAAIERVEKIDTQTRRAIDSDPTIKDGYYAAVVTAEVPPAPKKPARYPAPSLN